MNFFQCQEDNTVFQNIQNYPKSFKMMEESQTFTSATKCFPFAQSQKENHQHQNLTMSQKIGDLEKMRNFKKENSKPSCQPMNTPKLQSSMQEEEPITSEYQAPKVFKPSEWSLDCFDFAYALGQGKFGHVYLARERKSNLIVAIKALCKKQIMNCNLVKQILREIEIHIHVQHPNIIHFYGYFYDEKNIFYVLEYAPEGCLWDLMKKQPNKKFTEEKAALYVRQVASALDHLQKNNIIHRDLKPENVLVFPNDIVKLADFGWSVHAPSNSRTTYCGTPDYLCPEMINRTQYDSKVDNWTLGVLAYELLSGRPPFEASCEIERKQKIRNLHIKYPSHFSQEATNFIQSLLQRDPNKRITLEEAMSHPWLRKYE